jgi:hypothetical protein
LLQKSATEVADSTNYIAEPVADSNHAPFQKAETDGEAEEADSKALNTNEDTPSLTINNECFPSSSSVIPELRTTTMLPPSEDPDATDIGVLRTYLSQNGVSSDWEIVTDLVRKCRIHAPSCSVEQIISEIGGKLAIARRADRPMAWLRTAVPKCFVGANVIPIAAPGCPMPQCIELGVNALNRSGQCVNCGLTREIAQQRAASANDPALRALLAMRGVRT